MADFRLTTPVALMIFRRPDTTRRVLEAIERAQPSTLYVIADGPRGAQDVDACAETRALIDRIDWPCAVVRHYADTNLGLKRRFTSGLNWLFEQVDEAIILEDDCLPDDSFFRFCQTLLEIYRDDPRVMHISGTRIFEETAATSYSFSRFPNVWGWATWKRAWQLYDGDLVSWNREADRAAFLDRLADRDEKAFWLNILNRVGSGALDTWDYQWDYSCIRRDGLSVSPSVNLVSNLGFGVDATHTTDADNPFANLPRASMTFPLRHPDAVVRDVEADRWVAKTCFSFEVYWKTIAQQVSLARGNASVAR